MKQRSAICIIGGMGPQASVHLYKLLIDMSIRFFGAKNNDDFPEIILHSVPVPDFISSDTYRSEALKMLSEKVSALNKFNISCFALVCNTAHVFISQLQSLSKAPFISMIDEAVNQVRKDGRNKIGLLGTSSTIKYGVYQLALRRYEIDTIIPSKKQLNILEKIIRDVLKGKISKENKGKLVTIADSLKKQGAEGILLGCTELPLVFPSKYSLPVYNSVKILALALLRNYYK